MGDWDLVRKLMEQEGDLLFWRVMLRPGGPPLFGTWKGTPLFGLPGNPVSSLVVFHTLVSPGYQTLSVTMRKWDRGSARGYQSSWKITSLVPLGSYVSGESE